MELSFHSQVASGEASLADVLPVMAEAGMMRVESRSRGIDWTSADRHHSRRETAAALAATGVKLHTVHSPFGPDVDWCASDAGAARAAQAIMEYVIPTSAELGARLAVIHPSRGDETETPDEMRARVQAGLEKLLPMAEAAGIHLALENMPWSEQSAAQLAPLIREVGSPRLGACLDTGHANMGEGVTEAAAAFGSAIKHLHIHDNHGKSDEHLIPPNGTVDWPAFCAALKKTAFSGPLNFELRPAEEQGLSLRETREHLEEFFAGSWGA